MNRLFEWVCGVLAGGALFCIMALTFFDVGGRKLLSTSIPGSLELTELLRVVVIFAALPLVSMRGEHVVFDSMDSYLPPAIHTHCKSQRHPQQGQYEDGGKPEQGLGHSVPTSPGSASDGLVSRPRCTRPVRAHRTAMP